MGTHCSKACGRKYKVIKAYKLNVITREQGRKPAGALLCLLGNASLLQRKERKQKRERKGIKQPPRIRHVLRGRKINLSVKGGDHGVQLREASLNREGALEMPWSQILL